MTFQNLLYERKALLDETICNAITQCNHHTVAFIMRVLNPEYIETITGKSSSELLDISQQTNYGGFPEIASIGFMLASHNFEGDTWASGFLAGLERQQQRDDKALKSFIADDIAMLGVAEGLAYLSENGGDNSSLRTWLATLTDKSANGQWSSRIRALAGDLLDHRGRLRVGVQQSNMENFALEIVLRDIWPDLFLQTPYPTQDVLENLLKVLLTTPFTVEDEPERAAIWLKALDIVIDNACQGFMPTVSDVARILSRVQHSLKRWCWETKAKRGKAAPTQWLIDDEYHVQAILWAILYPIYGQDLLDERYLPNWGQKQPRADLVIKKLKLIIEVKFIRERANFEKVEEEVAGDLGIYFKDENLYNRMIVFVYDDCDTPHTERHDSLRNALKQRAEYIEDVIIIQRPSMIPSRSARKSVRSKTTKIADDENEEDSNGA